MALAVPGVVDVLAHAGKYLWDKARETGPNPYWILLNLISTARKQENVWNLPRTCIAILWIRT
jgi:hypothetical protein